MPNKHPVVFVHGILGFGPKELGPLQYWGSAFHVESPLPRHEASVGPLSSAHDRACELAAQIKGTRVDYGKEHAQQAGHHQHGADFSGQGFVSDWSGRRPVHLVGHSLGSPTIRCLQHLLASDFWGWGSSQDWVRSITTISGVSNGSSLVYWFGADERSGLLQRAATPLLRLLELFTAVSGGFLDSLYNFDLDQWGFERRENEPLDDYLKRVGRSDFLWGKDNAVYSLSLQGAFEDNGLWKTYPKTHYLSYLTEQTSRGLFSSRHYPDFRMNPALLASSTYIGQKEFVRLPIPAQGFKSSDWWENDGAVSTFSQQYPRTNGTHPVGREFDAATKTSSLGSGKWHWQWQRGFDHADICIAPQLTQKGRQRRFYTRLLSRLAELKK